MKQVATGYCLALGPSEVRTADIKDDARALLHAVAYARDLARGHMPMQIAAIGLERTVLSAIGEALTTHNTSQLTIHPVDVRE